jgi:hypothetical protein
VGHLGAASRLDDLFDRPPFHVGEHARSLHICGRRFLRPLRHLLFVEKARVITGGRA